MNSQKLNSNCFLYKSIMVSDAVRYLDSVYFTRGGEGVFVCFSMDLTEEKLYNFKMESSMQYPSCAIQRKVILSAVHLTSCWPFWCCYMPVPGTRTHSSKCTNIKNSSKLFSSSDIPKSPIQPSQTVGMCGCTHTFTYGERLIQENIHT